MSARISLKWSKWTKLFRKDVPQNYESYFGVVPWLFGQFQHWFGVRLCEEHCQQLRTGGPQRKRKIDGSQRSTHIIGSAYIELSSDSQPKQATISKYGYFKFKQSEFWSQYGYLYHHIPATTMKNGRQLCVYEVGGASKKMRCESLHRKFVSSGNANTKGYHSLAIKMMNGSHVFTLVSLSPESILWLVSDKYALQKYLKERIWQLKDKIWQRFRFKQRRPTTTIHTLCTYDR